jgi:hypothetical protein
MPFLGVKEGFPKSGMKTLQCLELSLYPIVYVVCQLMWNNLGVLVLLVEPSTVVGLGKHHPGSSLLFLAVDRRDEQVWS